jgi:D-3-phosphoglycerate dehydrogenase
MPTIAISDIDFDDTSFEQAMAREAGIDLEVYQDGTPEGIIANLANADGAVTSYGNYTREVFEALPRLKVLSRTGVGFDTIDVQAATECGVAVCTAPGYGTEVVSDHAITLAMGVLRRINEVDADLRRGIWDYESHRPYGQVAGRTFGVVGMGAIGRAVARKANGLGFDVICCSRSLVPGRRTPEGYPIYSFDELLKRVDVVSFHCALTPQTTHLLNAERIETMKPGAVVVNTSRGAVVDTVALAEALERGRLWGAGIDVFESEPVDPGHPIMKAPHTLLSPHVAYWSEESGRELRTRTMQSAIDVVCGRRPADCLNPEVFEK